MSDETGIWKYSKCLYCKKKDVDPHHDCQVVKQCKKKKKLKKCIFLVRVNFLPYNREEETSLVSW